MPHGLPRKNKNKILGNRLKRRPESVIKNQGQKRDRLEYCYADSDTGTDTDADTDTDTDTDADVLIY